MTEKEKLLEEIERFLREFAMKPTVFGVKALHDTAFVSRLRDVRRDATLETAARVRKFMADYRKKDHKPARPTGGAGRARRAA